jgi:hypothetical protein
MSRPATTQIRRLVAQYSPRDTGGAFRQMRNIFAPRATLLGKAEAEVPTALPRVVCRAWPHRARAPAAPQAPLPEPTPEAVRDELRPVHTALEESFNIAAAAMPDHVRPALLYKVRTEACVSTWTLRLRLT